MLRGTLWTTLAGFTSFGIHAGGPPTQAYLLSLQVDKGRFQGTTVAFFFMLNWLKAPMFAWLGDTRSGTFTPVRQGPDYTVGPLAITCAGKPAVRASMG